MRVSTLSALSVLTLGSLLCNPASAVVVVPVTGSSSAASAARAKAEQERQAQIAAAVASAPRTAPCWYQVPGKMQLVNLNLVQEVMVQAAHKGMQPVLMVTPGRRVEFEVPQEKVAGLFPELMALTQACAGSR